MRPRRLKLGTHMDSGQMYRVYGNLAAADYSSLYFFIFFHSNFQTLKIFVTLLTGTVRPRRLKLGTHWTVGGCIVYTGIRLLLLIRPFFFLLYYSNIKNFRQTFLLEGWNVVHTWTMGGCIVYTGIRRLLHIRPFIFSFFFLSNFQTLKCFCHTLYRSCEA